MVREQQSGIPTKMALTVVEQGQASPFPGATNPNSRTPFAVGPVALAAAYPLRLPLGAGQHWAVPRRLARAEAVLRSGTAHAQPNAVASVTTPAVRRSSARKASGGAISYHNVYPPSITRAAPVM
jgi:hypothetical protein